MKRWEIYLEIFMELVFGVFVLFAVLFILPKLLGFLWPFIAGWVIAMVANPLRNFLQRKIKVSKRFGSALIMISAILISAGGLYLIISKLITEGRGFVESIPVYYKDFLDILSQINIWFVEQCGKLGISQESIERLSSIFTSLQGEITSGLSGMGGSGMKYAGSFAKGVTSGLISTIVMLLASYFFLVEREDLIRGYHDKVSGSLKKKVSMLKDNIMKAVGGYFLAQVKIMGVIFIILFVGLFLAHAPYAFLLGLLICIVDVLPFLGTGTILIPWAVFKFIDHNFRFGVILIVTYIICLLARQLLQPKIIGDSVGLKPLPTLFLMYVGLKLGGILGFIFAIILGIMFLNMYHAGIFDGWINRIKHRMALLKEVD